LQRHSYSVEQSTPDFFMKGPSVFSRFVFLSVLSIALIVTDSRLHYLQAFRDKLEAYLHPLSLMANAPVELYTKVNQNLTSYEALQTENKLLRNQLLKIRTDVQAVYALKSENQQLRQLTKLDKTIKQKQILAEILHASSNKFKKEVVVNRGSAHLVELGAAVVDSTGVIGQVTRLYPQTSQVTLITNTDMEIPVMVARNGLRAIAIGVAEKNHLSIPYLPANVDIKVGDALVTSGIDQVYPPGYAIGVVDEIDIEPGDDFIRISCKVAGGVDLHRHVIVVNPQTPLVEASSAISAEDVDLEGSRTKSDSEAKSVKSYMSQGEILVSE